MTMDRTPNPLIAELSDDLAPVRPMTLRAGLALLAIAIAGSVLFVEVAHGLWAGAFTGEAAPMFWIANGLLLVLGLACATSVVTMAGPRVGNRHEAPRWTVAAVGVLPLAALAAAYDHGAMHSPLDDPYGFECLRWALLASVLTAGTLVWWLRRGAPVSLDAAGWYTGIAAGALGSVAYGFSCPLDGAMHLGVWHVLPVVVTAMLGRLVVPPLVRW